MNTKRRTGRARAILSFAAVFFLAANVSEARYSGGTGESNDPYRIATPNDLNDIGNHPEDFNDCFILVNDINMAGFTYTTALIAPDINNNIDDFQGTKFTGIFDGNDHKITVLTIDDAGIGNDYLGLFGCNSGEINNLGLEQCYVSGQLNIGGMVGYNSGDVSKCYSIGTVAGTYVFVGGLVGQHERGSLSNCHSNVSVTGYRIVGGLVGMNRHNGSISDSYSNGCVLGTAQNVGDIGGLVGSSRGSISNCYSTASVNSDGDYLGGLVGRVGYYYDEEHYGDFGSVSRCYSTGDVNGGENVGGLVGFNCYGSVTDCYCTGDVNGRQDVGGLVGDNGHVGLGSLSRCYSTGDVNGANEVGGLVGDNDANYVSDCFWDIDKQTHGITESFGYTEGTVTNVEGLSTGEMQIESTFTDAGWDFIEIWDIGENQTYPFLRVYPAGDLGHDGIVNFMDVAILADHWLEGTGP